MKTSEHLEIGRKYMRSDLQKMFDIADETIKLGVFKLKGRSSIWLFITQENSQPDYRDEIVGTRLQFSGQMVHGHESDVIEHLQKDLEIIVFFRQQNRGAFTYCGRAEYVSHLEDANRPVLFIAHLLDVSRDKLTGEFIPVTSQDIVKEQVRFVADTHLIQVLGEQLIASEKVGILELIKNAYDAGATECTVWIEKVPNIPLPDAASEIQWSDAELARLDGPVITVLDNGCGMDYRTLVSGWLRPATTIKTSLKRRLKEEREKADTRGTRASYERLLTSIKDANNGRLPLGEKGVGRFATHRLGRYLQLNTKTAGDEREWKLTINWTRFDEVAGATQDLSSIPLDLVHQPPEIDYGSTGSGTRLRIYGGREGFEWNSDTLTDIGYAIVHLKSPVRTPTGFDPAFICPQLSDTLEIPINNAHVPFQCTALVEDTGLATIEIRFSPPPSLDLPMQERAWKEVVDLRTTNSYWQIKDEKKKDKPVLRQPQCGAFLVDVKCWLRRSPWIHGADRKHLTKYLDDFGGIGIFRNGLAILPAQDAAQEDWLGLEAEIIGKGQNISYYNLAGSVEITQEENFNLIDQTSREGLLLTTPYKDLSKLVRAVIDRLNIVVKEIRAQEERLRLGTSIPRATLNKQARITEQVLDKLSENYDFEKDSVGLLEVFKIDKHKVSQTSVSNILQDLKRASNGLRHEVDRLDEQLSGLLEVAGFAISIGVAIHEIEKITDNVYHGLNRIVQITEANTDVHERAVILARTAQGLLNELRRIAPLRVTRLEKKIQFSVRDAIVAASGAFQRKWADEEIKFVVPPKAEDFEVLGAFSACSQVFANLFDNATYWLMQTPVINRNIGVFIDVDRKQVLVADSGPGISDMIQEHLFEPFYSLKSPPSGLGLYICRYYMRQLKRGDIRIARPIERRSEFAGAQFLIIFPKLDEEE